MAKETLDTVAKRVERLLELSGLSGVEFSRIAGLSRPVVSGVIRSGGCSVDTGRKIAQASGATVGWLLDGEGNGPSRKTVLDAVEAASAAAGPRVAQ